MSNTDEELTNEINSEENKIEEMKQEEKKEEEEKDLSQMGYFESSIYQWKHLKMTVVKVIRLVFLVVGLIAEVLNNFLGYMIPMDTSVSCLDDKVFSHTTSINSFFSEHNYFKNFLMIVSSLAIDVYILLSFCNSILFSKGFNFVISVILFYLLLIAIRPFFLNEIPSDFLFDSPHFPSIFVPYYKASSFYFSPTIGILVLCCIEWERSKRLRYLMMGIGIGLVVFESLFMMILRKHFVCDIFSSLVFSHFIYMVVEKYANNFIYKTILKRSEGIPENKSS
ncbi:MAG: hypothetical protein MJ252_24995 [archaeon]|nr:hypothetical protein [archaeon]